MAKHPKPPVIDKLPQMKMRQIMRVWDNAIQIIADKSKKRQHTPANMVLGAIRKEWKRRGRLPPDPSEFFKWPSTEAPGGSGRIQTDGWEREGVLSYMGYHVGTTNGRSAGVRKTILSQVFDGPLPPVFPPGYLTEWGKPGSSVRLRKMAETLAAFVRNGKRRNDSRMVGAIRDWEKDLRFLYGVYYIDRFHFAWPDTSVM